MKGKKLSTTSLWFLLVLFAIWSAPLVHGTEVEGSSGTYSEKYIGVGSWTEGNFQTTTSGNLSELTASFRIKGSGTIQLTIGTEDFIPFARPHKTRIISINESGWISKSFSDFEWFGISHFATGIPTTGNGATLGLLQAATLGSGNVINWKAINPAGTLTALTPGSFSVEYINIQVSSGLYLDAVTINGTTYDLEPLNSAPVANAQNVEVSEDTDQTVTLTATDPDLDSLIFSIVQNPQHGSLGGVPPNVIYSPNSNYNGSDSFTFRASDGSSYSDKIVSITINPVNDSPIANAQFVATIEDIPINITLIGSDIDSSPIFFSLATNPSHGAISGFNPLTGDLIYGPHSGYSGADLFTFKVNDGVDNSTEATVYITINAAPTPTPVPPTNTPVPPTPTFTKTPTPTNTIHPTITATSTSVPPTPTFTKTPTPIPTNTPVPPEPTATPEVIITATPNPPTKTPIPPSPTATQKPGNHAPVINLQDEEMYEGERWRFKVNVYDPDKDPFKFIKEGEVLPPGATFNHQTFYFDWTPNYSQAGTYVLKIEAVDEFGAKTTRSVAITVIDIPNPPPSPTNTPKSIATPTKINTSTPINTPTVTPEIIPTATPVLPSPTSIATPTSVLPTNTPEPTSTMISTPEPEPTSTPTATPVLPTATLVPPTAIPTNTPTVTNTPKPTATNTPVPPVPTNTPVPTKTPVPEPIKTNYLTSEFFIDKNEEQVVAEVLNFTGNQAEMSIVVLIQPFGTAEYKVVRSSGGIQYYVYLTKYPSEPTTATITIYSKVGEYYSSKSSAISFIRSPVTTPTQTPTATLQPTLTPTPTITPTPTVTPTPTFVPRPTATPIKVKVLSNNVIITDDIRSGKEDLSGKKDEDEEDERELVIRWNLSDLFNIKQFHVYVLVNNSAVYLGRTETGEENYLIWESDNPKINIFFRDGPQFGNSYRFQVYAITISGTPVFYGPFQNAGPVHLLKKE